MDVQVKRLTADEVEEMGIMSWSEWEKEVGEFDWYYHQAEEFYVVEGQASVDDGEEEVSFGTGDFVVMPKGLDYTWRITKPIKKRFRVV